MKSGRSPRQDDRPRPIPPRRPVFPRLPRRRRRADYALAGLAGLRRAVSFPSPGTSAPAWLALPGRLVVVDPPSLPRALALRLAPGGVHFAGTLYWIPAVMHT